MSTCWKQTSVGTHFHHAIWQADSSTHLQAGLNCQQTKEYICRVHVSIDLSIPMEPNLSRNERVQKKSKLNQRYEHMLQTDICWFAFPPCYMEKGLQAGLNCQQTKEYIWYDGPIDLSTPIKPNAMLKGVQKKSNQIK